MEVMLVGFELGLGNSSEGPKSHPLSKSNHLEKFISKSPWPKLNSSQTQIISLSLSLSLSLFNWVDLDASHHSLPPCPNQCLKVVWWHVGGKFPTLTSKVTSSLARIWGEYGGFCLWVVLGILVGIEVCVVVVNHTCGFGLCLNWNCSKNLWF